VKDDFGLMQPVLLVARSPVRKTVVYLRATTNSYSTYSIMPIEIEVEEPDTSGTITPADVLLNTMPRFSQAPETRLEVEVVLDEEGNVQTPTLFSYESPKAEDKEGQEVKMSFRGLEG